MATTKKMNAMRKKRISLIDAELENLGIWDGWNHGKFPPYWGRLRQYVFARDKYRCSRCHKRFRDARYLDAHHVVPWQIGGSDRPKNLQTVCEPCHDAIHDATLLFAENVSEPDPKSSDRSETLRSALRVHYEVNGQHYTLPDTVEKWEYIGDVVQGVPSFSIPSAIAEKAKILRGTVQIRYRSAIFHSGHIHLRRWGKRGSVFSKISLCGANRVTAEGHISIYVDDACGPCVKIAEDRDWLEVIR